MIIREAQPHLVLPCPQRQSDLKDHIPFRWPDFDLMAGQVVPDGRLLFPGHSGNDLQNFSRVPSHGPGGGCRLNTLEPGVGHHDALYIFNDIPAGLYQNSLWKPAQNLPGLGRAIGNGDGLRTAHGGHQLLPENLDEMAITGIGPFHGGSPLCPAK